MGQMRALFKHLREGLCRLVSSTCDPIVSERRFPPRRPLWKWLVLTVLYLVLVITLALGSEQFFFITPPILGTSNIAIVYISFGIFISAIISDRYLRHRIIAHKERLQDPSEILTTMAEAETLKPRYVDPENDDDVAKWRPTFYDERKEEIRQLVSELRDESEYAWTEQRVLCLDLLLIEFQPLHDLKAWADSLVDDLGEYAEDSSYRYDKEYYGRWKERVDSAKRQIEGKDDNDISSDDAAEGLRAEVSMLLTHVASYKAFWTEGSVFVRGIMIGGGVAIPLLLVMGLAPHLHPSGPWTLGILNWGLLGIVGSLAAVLLALRKSDLVEVGNTEGKKELWRTIIGSVLGLVAGILAYSLVGGEVIKGNAVPEINPLADSQKLRDIALAVIWAIGAGFSFERIFERVRGYSDASN